MEIILIQCIKYGINFIGIGPISIFRGVGVGACASLCAPLQLAKRAEILEIFLTVLSMFFFFFFFYELEHRTGKMCPFLSLHPLKKRKRSVIKTIL